MMVNAAMDNGHGLLEQSILLELVRINQRSHKTSMCRQIRAAAGRRRHRRRAGRFWTGNAPIAGLSSQRRQIICMSTPSLGSFRSSLLLTRRKWCVQLTIDEEISQDAGWRPGQSICPTLDAGRYFLVDEHAAAHNEIASIFVMRSTATMVQHALKACLEDEQGISGGLDVPVPGRYTGRRSCARVHPACLAA